MVLSTLYFVGQIAIVNSAGKCKQAQFYVGIYAELVCLDLCICALNNALN